MKRVRNWQKILEWHKKVAAQHDHPIFDPEYARENLAALGETSVMFFFYISIFLLFIHFLGSNGVFEQESLLMLLVEKTTGDMIIKIPLAGILEKTNIFITIIVFSFAAFASRQMLEIYKVSLHPKKRARVLVK